MKWFYHLFCLVYYDWLRRSMSPTHPDFPYVFRRYHESAEHLERSLGA